MSTHQDLSTEKDTLSPSSFPITVFLCLMFGVLGLHRFYVGKIGTGILQILTLGGLGFWAIYDLIILVMGQFTDSWGRLVKQR